jgi:hypothetical protein
MTRFCLAPVLAACALLPHEFPLFISVHKLRWFARTSQLTAVEVLYVAFFWALALDSQPASMCVVNFHVIGQCVVLKVRSWLSQQCGLSISNQPLAADRTPRLQVLERGGGMSYLYFDKRNMLHFFGLMKLIRLIDNINIFDTMERLRTGVNFLNPLEEEGARTLLMAQAVAAGGARGAGAVPAADEDADGPPTP